MLLALVLVLSMASFSALAEDQVSYTESGAKVITYGEQIELKVPIYQRNGIKDPIEDNWWTHWVQENFGDKYNIKVTYIPISRTDEVTDFTNKMGSKDTAPDMIFHYDNPQLLAYIDQEFVQEIGVSGMAEFGNLVALASNKGEVITFDRERDVIISKDSYLPRNGLTHDQDCKPRYDREGNLWIITSAGSFVRDAKTGKWAHSVISYLQSLGINNVPEELSLWDMLADDKQCIWLATDHGGLYVIDLKGKEMKQFLNNKYDESSLSDNTLRNLYQDQLGRMWIGSYMNGLNLTVSSASMFRNKEMGVINTICYDKRGYTWLGTNDKGIIRFDSRTDEVVVYNKENSGIGSNTMVGSLAASDGSVWFGTYEGGLIHIKNGQFTNYRATGDTLGLANNNVWTVYEDQWGNIWIGTLGGGVQRIDKKTGRFTTLNTRN
jgi:streptogramin lyase